MKKEVTTDQAPAAEHILSQGIVSGNTIYLAGQIHAAPGDTMVEGSTEERLDRIMKNMEAVLAEANATLDDLVKVVIYVTDMAQMPAINQAYPTYFSKPYPVREAVCVKELPLGATIEISGIAVKTQDAVSSVKSL